MVRELSKLSGGGVPGIVPTFVLLIGTPHATNQLDALFDQLFAAAFCMGVLEIGEPRTNKTMATGENSQPKAIALTSDIPKQV